MYDLVNCKVTVTKLCYFGSVQLPGSGYHTEKQYQEENRELMEKVGFSRTLDNLHYPPPPGET